VPDGLAGHHERNHHLRADALRQRYLSFGEKVRFLCQILLEGDLALAGYQEPGPGSNGYPGPRRYKWVANTHRGEHLQADLGRWLVVDELAQSLQARVDVFVRMVVRAAGQLEAAHDAKPGAILPAQRRDRFRQQDSVADLLLEVQLVVVCQPQGIWLVVEVDRLARRQVESRQRLFVEVELHGPFDLPQATTARLGNRGLEPAADQ